MRFSMERAYAGLRQTAEEIETDTDIIKLMHKNSVAMLNSTGNGHPELRHGWDTIHKIILNRITELTDGRPTDTRNDDYKYTSPPQRKAKRAPSGRGSH